MRFVAGQGAAAESHREHVAGRGAVAESLCGRGCRSAEAVAAAAWKRLPLRRSRDGCSVEEVAAPRKPMRHQRKSLLLPLRSTAWHHREAHAGKEKQCWHGGALRARRSNAGREKQCEQGETVLAGRNTADREEQCGLLVDEDGEVVPSEYLLRHALELCGCETLYFGTGGLHWLYVAEDHH